jgi:hypothetical protein
MWMLLSVLELLLVRIFRIWVLFVSLEVWDSALLVSLEIRNRSTSCYSERSVSDYCLLLRALQNLHM